MKIIIFFLLLSISLQTYALDQNDYFYVKKSSCDLRVAPLEKKYKYIKADITKYLLKKGYKSRPFFDQKRVIPGEEYIIFSFFKTKDFWKKCGLEIIVRKAKSNTPRKTDKLILKHQTLRSIPRVTPSGNERCVRALKDILVHLPYCKKI